MVADFLEWHGFGSICKRFFHVKLWDWILLLIDSNDSDLTSKSADHCGYGQPMTTPTQVAA